MARKPYVRTRADERAVLAAYSTEGLALRIVEIGESMQLRADADGRARPCVDRDWTMARW